MRLIVSILVVVFFAVGGASWAEVLPQSASQLQLSFAPVVKTTAPAVVNVYSKTLVRQENRTTMFDDPFFRQFFGQDGGFGRPRERVQNSLGSGVIVDPKGVIVTNNHVVKGGQDIRVVLADKREFEAKILLADERSDLAVLKIDVGEEELASLSFGDSDNLEVGDLVLAIGNPFGVGQTVTSGIVSALARTHVGITDYQFFIQTDAAINPGNSGGALVNMAGELVGINTAIFSRSGGSIGIGFSIPSNMVRTVVASAEHGGRLQRPWVGADFQDVTPDLADSLGLSRPGGALIANLHPQGPLLRAGLKQGDVILAIDGFEVDSARAFGYRLATAGIGHSALIEFQRGGKLLQATVKLVAAPELTAREQTLIEQRSPLQGLVVANLSPAVAEEAGVPGTLSGVVALEIKGGPAEQFFRKGDIITAINDAQISTVADVLKALEDDPGYWQIGLTRQGRRLQMTLR